MMAQNWIERLIIFREVGESNTGIQHKDKERPTTLPDLDGLWEEETERVVRRYHISLFCLPHFKFRKDTQEAQQYWEGGGRKLKVHSSKNLVDMPGFLDMSSRKQPT